MHAFAADGGDANANFPEENGESAAAIVFPDGGMNWVYELASDGGFDGNLTEIDQGPARAAAMRLECRHAELPGMIAIDRNVDHAAF